VEIRTVCTKEIDFQKGEGRTERERQERERNKERERGLRVQRAVEGGVAVVLCGGNCCCV
jgi:hypothetical protein